MATPVFRYTFSVMVWAVDKKQKKSLSFLKVFQKNSKSFRTRNNDYPQERTHRKMLPTKIEQKFMATLSKGNRRIYKVLLREAAKSSNLNLTPHTTVFHQFPYYSHLWTMSRVPGNRTGIEIRSFKDQLIVNLMSFSI